VTRSEWLHAQQKLVRCSRDPSKLYASMRALPESVI
jgi:hypothetical protein